MAVRLLRSGSIHALGCTLALALALAGCGSTTVPLSAQAPSLTPGSAIASASPPTSPAPTSSPTAPPTPSPAPSLDRVVGWRADIDGLLAARESTHPDPWHGMARADWVAAADAVKARIPDMNDDQALVELVRLAAMPGWKGRDGHTGIFLTPGSGIHPYPLRFWRFSDGLVITAAQAPYEDLVGSRVTAIGGHPIDEVLRLVEPLSPRDNPSTLLAYAPRYAGVSELLAGLGVIDDAGPATFSLVGPGRQGARRHRRAGQRRGGRRLARRAAAPPAADQRAVAPRPGQGTVVVLPAESRTLFVQYNAVEAGINGIADEILARAKEDDVARVVVDLRHNGGGDNTTMGHFEDVLRDPAINQPGRLVVLMGRAHVLGRRQLRDRPRAVELGDVRRRGDGRQPEPVRRRPPDRPPVRRPIGLRGDAVLAAKHGRRPADHDRARRSTPSSRPPTISPAAIRFSRRSSTRRWRRAEPSIRRRDLDAQVRSRSSAMSWWSCSRGS